MRNLLSRPLLIALLVPVLGAAGCAGTVIDSQKAEDAIADNVEEATGVKVESVVCPDDVEVVAGTRFECDVSTGDGRQAVAELKILNDDADVRVLELRKPQEPVGVRPPGSEPDRSRRPV